jgi:intracellular multiplication protein IcmO
MPILLKKFELNNRNYVLRDVRPASVRVAEFMSKPDTMAAIFTAIAAVSFVVPALASVSDFLGLFAYIYFRKCYNKSFTLPFKFPKNAGVKDPNNPKPGKSGAGPAEGIMFIGNINDPDDPQLNRELWLTNNDTRTHILFIGTTGSGKTEGLKSLVSNSLTWGSGFVYVDGKADTDLWASLYSLARRFGRDDDLLVLNYMTANSDDGATSNTMNPFSNGSASYLSNMVTSLMPDAGGDNAMWKERAVALLSALMPALTWKRDKQGLLLDVGVLREYIELKPIIALSRDQNLPERIIRGLQGYLNTLPGYVDAAFDDEGNERPPSPDQPMYDLQVARQQHGYLSMQFTRSLQSLADEYGYIFKVQLADIDVLDTVLNRRILVALIPALEKSGDEAANLGKIIAASLKGMMGATLGNTVEGSWEMAIGSKQTRSASSFMTVFDEVGYYTAPGMAVMAAQARSLGFSLVFAAQDLPSLEKRVKQEAQSILANCNLKIFGKIEDPTETKDFLDKHAGSSWVMESSGMSSPTSSVSSLFMNNPFYDNRGSSGATTRQRVSYDHLRGQREGQVHMFFGDWAVRADLFHAVPEKVGALRVHRMLPVPGTTTSTAARERAMTELAARLKDPEWTAGKAPSKASPSIEIETLAAGLAENKDESRMEAAVAALVRIAALPAPKKEEAAKGGTKKKPTAASDEESSPSQALSAWGQPSSSAVTFGQPQEDEMGGSFATAPAPYDEGELRERAETRRGLPPLQEGDQFAISELEEVFFETAVHVADELNAPPILVEKTMPPNIDIHAALPPVEASASDVLGVELPPEMAEIVEKSAEKLNKGLSDSKA